MNLKPICYLEHLTDIEIEEYECSDKIWVPQHVFESFVGNNEPGIATIVQLTNEYDQSTVGCMSEIHYQDNNDVYVPQWMWNMIGINNDIVRITRFHANMCIAMTLEPHTSDHLSASDPQELLKVAFESFSCIYEGQTVPLWIQHPTPHIFYATVTKLQPAHIACIRNCDVELELLRPLDMPEPQPLQYNEPEQPHSMPKVSGLILGGQTPPSDKSVRELALEAALRRLGHLNSNI